MSRLFFQRDTQPSALISKAYQNSRRSSNIDCLNWCNPKALQGEGACRLCMYTLLPYIYIPCCSGRTAREQTAAQCTTFPPPVTIYRIAEVSNKSSGTNQTAGRSTYAQSVPTRQTRKPLAHSKRQGGA